MKEQVLWFLNGVADLLRMLVGFCSNVAQGIGWAFDLEISDGGSSASRLFAGWTCHLRVFDPTVKVGSQGQSATVLSHKDG